MKLLILYTEFVKRGIPLILFLVLLCGCSGAASFVNGLLGMPPSNGNPDMRKAGQQTKVLVEVFPWGKTILGIGGLIFMIGNAVLKSKGGSDAS